MSGERPAPGEAIRYAEEVDREIAGLRAAVGDPIDRLDVTGVLMDLEAG